MTHVVVVGGGITGLAAAWEAQQLGAEVTVLESSDRFGGKLRTVGFAGRPVDVGADAFLVRRPEGVQLAAELGLADELVHPTAARVWMWARGALRPMPAETVFGVPSRIRPVARSGVLSPAAVARAALEPLVARLRGLPDLADPGVAHPTRPAGAGTASGRSVVTVSAGPHRGRSTSVGHAGHVDGALEPSVSEVVARAFGRAVADDLVEPLLGGIYAGRAERLGLWSAAPALATPLARGHALGSFTAALRAQRAAADPSAPVFATLPGGLGSLVDRLVERLRADGADLRRHAKVMGMERRSGSGGFELRVVPRPPSGSSVPAGEPLPTWSATGASDRGEVTPDDWPLRDGTRRLEADAVVVTVPATTAGQVLLSVVPEAAHLLGGIAYADVATISLAYRREDVGDVPVGSGALVPARSGLLVKAMTWGWQKWAHQDVGDLVTLRASVGRIDDHRALGRRGDVPAIDPRALRRRVDAEVRAITGIDGPAVERRLTPWFRGLPQYEPGHADRVAAIHAAVAQVPGLAVAGAALDGVGVAPCIAQGRASARRVLERNA